MLLNPYRFGVAFPQLLTNLVSYWSLDEASGNAIDAHGTNHLTDTNTVTSTAGIVNTARDFTSANVEYFTRTSGASLSTGDIDFTISVWVKFRTVVSSGIVSKWISTPSSILEFMLFYQTTNNRFEFQVVINLSGTVIRANNFGVPVTGVWYHIVCWHDSVNNNINISVNNGTADTTPYGGGVNAHTGIPFQIGAWDNGLAGPFNGQIDEVGFWKRVLSPAERAALYNSGNGLAYPFGTGYIPPPVAEFSGTPRTGTFPFAVTFTDLSDKTPTSWAWAKNNGSGWVPFAGTPTAQHPVETFVAGTWDVRLTAMNAAGSDDEVKTGYVTNISPLLTNLISYWKLDEASGNAVDSHGTNTLTDVNTVASAAGKIGNARDFELGNVEYFTIASNASLQTGNISFTLTAWVKLESLGTVQVIAGKDNAAASREYTLYFDGTVNRFSALISTNGSATTGVVANAFGALSAGVWYFAVFWYDSTTDLLNLQVNNGGINTTSNSGGAFVGTAGFRIGALDNASTPLTLDGLIDEVGFWKRVLTPAERTELYNSGNGLAYPFT